jgi:hypothetical protein
MSAAEETKPASVGPSSSPFSVPASMYDRRAQVEEFQVLQAMFFGANEFQTSSETETLVQELQVRKADEPATNTLQTRKGAHNLSFDFLY